MFDCKIILVHREKIIMSTFFFFFFRNAENVFFNGRKYEFYHCTERRDYTLIGIIPVQLLKKFTKHIYIIS